MGKKIECITLRSDDREQYPELYSKTELKKLKLMPKINVKPAAVVIRKYYDNYYLYDINKTTDYKLTIKQKKELSKKAKENRKKRLEEKKRSICKKCGLKMEASDRVYNNHEEFYDYICKNCYEKIYNNNKEAYINNLMNKKIICIDVETTGLLNNDEIVQVSAINEKGEVLINKYCKPENKSTWDDAMRIHGITPEMVKDCKPYSFYKNEIQKLFDQAEVIVGYNIYFDLGFLECNCDNKQITDVMKIFAYVYGDWNSYYKSYRWKKLSECADYYNYKFEAHDSLEDVRATLFCYPRSMYDYNFNIYKYI